MKQDERLVLFYDLRVKSRAQHAVNPSLSEMLSILAQERDDGRFHHRLDNQHLTLMLWEIAVDQANEIATLLIRRSDRRSPEYGYSNGQTGALRMFRKEEGEGGDAAAHLVVSLRANAPDSYLSMLEGVTGLSHRLVISLLNGLLRGFYKGKPDHFTYPDPVGARTREGTEKRHAFKPQLSLVGHISDTLKHDLENGRIENIELTNERVRSQIGGDPYLESRRFRLSISVNPNIPRVRVLDRIASAVRSKRASYDKARIEFRDPSGQSRRVELDLDTGSVEQGYVQAHRIGPIAPPLQMTTTNIVERVASPMRQILLAQR